MKVAHFISTSGLYGAERWILALLQHIKVDSLIVCLSTSDKTLLDEAEKKDIETEMLRIHGNYNVLDGIFKLVSLIKMEKITILHTHGYKSDLIGYFAAKIAGIKVISTPHGWSLYGGLKIKFFEFVDKHFLKFLDLVIPISEGIAKEIKSKKNIKIVNNFVDLHTIPKAKKGNPRVYDKRPSAIFGSKLSRGCRKY